ncbi:MAG: transglutaminase domain-containing protein [Chloroflexi bacterium]|nr:transglutaminase domain-containing protein [Chloroflexota bacterium]
MTQTDSFDPASIFLVYVLLALAAWGVAAAEWTPDLWSLQFVALGAALAGMALARSRFRALTAAIFATGYGGFWIGFLLCNTLPARLTWHERSLDLLYRIGDFVNRVLTGNRSEDKLMFVLVLAIIFWIIGVLAAWNIVRHRDPWAAFVPGGMVLLVNLIYYYGPAPMGRYLAVYLAVALLLLARTHVRAREAEWRANRVGYSTEIRFEFWRAGVIAGAVILGLAWFAPGAAASPSFAAAWQNVTSPWESVRSSWRRMFASVQGYSPTSGDYYGSALELSGAVNLSERPIMDVRAEPGPHFYWRARVFDHYENGRWTTTDRARLDLKGNDRGLQLPRYAARKPVTVTFILYTPATSTLYGVPQPYAFSRDAQLELNVNAAGEADISAARARQVVVQGGSYTVLSSLSTADEAQLRSAGTAYPAEIRERYLQVPDSISARTRALAHDVAADQFNAYDTAIAIQNYLRTHITYSRNIANPPAGQDPVDWVLFAYQKGYCNYYASAMTMMLRAVGIPARVSVGFAQGAFDLDTGLYRVVESDAHAWPEVFFPGYGWVEFEPTPSQPVIDRTVQVASNGPASASNPSPGGPGVDPNQRDLIDRDRQRVREESLARSRSTAWWGGSILLGVVALAVGFGVWRRRRRGGRPGAAPATPAVLAYARLIRAASLVGVTLRPGWTPRERATAISEKLPSGRPQIDQITTEYETETFGHSDRHGWNARTAWRRLRLIVLLGAAKRVVRRVTREE